MVVIQFDQGKIGSPVSAMGVVSGRQWKHPLRNFFSEAERRVPLNAVNDFRF